MLPSSPRHTRGGVRREWDERLAAHLWPGIHCPCRVAVLDSLLGRECPVPGCCVDARHCSGEPTPGESDEDAFQSRESRSRDTPVGWSPPIAHNMNSPWATVVGSSEPSGRSLVLAPDRVLQRRLSHDHG